MPQCMMRVRASDRPRVTWFCHLERFHEGDHEIEIGIEEDAPAKPKPPQTIRLLRAKLSDAVTEAERRAIRPLYLNVHITLRQAEQALKALDRRYAFLRHRSGSDNG